jgi:hypothetical protein
VIRIDLEHEEFMLIRRALINMGNGYLAERIATPHREEQLIASSEAIYALLERLSAAHPSEPAAIPLPDFDGALLCE